MVKILLISPSVFDYYHTPGRKEPLGLLYVKTALEKINGVSVDLYDMTLSGKKKKIPPPSSFFHLDTIYQEDTSVFSLFSSFYRFGDSFRKLSERLRVQCYDIIAISALFSGYFPDVETCIEEIKKVSNALIVVGGWAVMAEKRALFEQSKADIFILGPGEEIFPKLLRAIINKRAIETVPGLLYKIDGAICSTPEHTPGPITDEFPLRTQDYYFNKKRCAKVIISRGCCYTCDFCAIHRSAPFSIRLLQSIEEEFRYLLDQGVEIVNFEDDNLFYSKDFSNAFIPLLQKYHEKGFSYAAMNGITARNIVPYVDELISAGFIEFNLSLVTSHDTVSQNLHRPFAFPRIREIAEKTANRIPVLVFLIIGLPDSTPEMVLHDILELSKLPVIIGASPLYIVPGVPMFDAFPMPHDRRMLRGSALNTFGKNFTREDVASLWKLVRMINWLKKTDDVSGNDEQEMIAYWNRSVAEKSWYRKAKDGKWKKGFGFGLKLPKVEEMV